MGKRYEEEKFACSGNCVINSVLEQILEIGKCDSDKNWKAWTLPSIHTGKTGCSIKSECIVTTGVQARRMPEKSPVTDQIVSLDLQATIQIKNRI